MCVYICTYIYMYIYTYLYYSLVLSCFFFLSLNCVCAPSFSVSVFLSCMPVLLSLFFPLHLYCSSVCIEKIVKSPLLHTFTPLPPPPTGAFLFSLVLIRSVSFSLVLCLPVINPQEVDAITRLSVAPTMSSLYYQLYKDSVVDVGLCATARSNRSTSPPFPIHCQNAVVFSFHLLYIYTYIHIYIYIYIHV